MTRNRDVRGGVVGSPIVFLTVAVAVGLIGAAALAGPVAAHEEDADLAAHNQTQVADENGVVTTLTVDKATADEEFYVDVHGPDGDLNETATFEANTTLENLELALEPGIENDTTLTVATHAANGTELESEEITVSVAEAPTVEFSDQVRELDEHDEVHTIVVDLAAANQDYYVDVHGEDEDLNETATFEAGTAQTDLELALDPTIESTQNVTVAVHATNGTELVNETGTVTPVGLSVSDQEASGEVDTLTVESAVAGTGFYIDVHGEDEDLNETATFEAGTTLENLELALEPGVTDSEEVSVAIHATDGTELLAESVAIDVQETNGTDGEMNGTDGMNGSDGGTTDAGTEDGEESSGSGAGFGVVAALAAIAAALTVARRR